jgi:ribosomal protein S14
MANLVLRDLKKRKLFKNLEPKRILYKSIIQDLSFPKQLRFTSSIELTKLPRNSSLSRIRNRCIKTGRGKAILKKFRLSRISFRELASQGLLPGVLKSSW